MFVKLILTGLSISAFTNIVKKFTSATWSDVRKVDLDGLKHLGIYQHCEKNYECKMV